MIVNRRQFLAGIAATGLVKRVSALPKLPEGKVIGSSRITKRCVDIKADIEIMESTVALDGLKISPDKINGTNQTGTLLGWQVWRNDLGIDLSRWEPEIAALESTPFVQYTDNFLAVYCSAPGYAPTYKDWFDDAAWNTYVLPNVVKIASVIGRCQNQLRGGMLFDVESYQGEIFRYPLQRYATTKSFSEYYMKVRQRGKEFMAAIQEGYANCNVMVTYGYSLAYRPPIFGGLLETSKNGLLPAFIDGMLEQIRPPQLLYDGFENAYDYKTASAFESGYQTIHRHNTCYPWYASDVEMKFRQHYRASFGLWVDYYSNATYYPWETVAPFGGNYFSPTDFEHAVRTALQYTDRYVWIYTYTPDWYATSMPQAYKDALRNAKT